MVGRMGSTTQIEASAEQVLEALRAIGCNDDICVLDAVEDCPELLEDELVWLRYKAKQGST